jgi:hypothetical protein
MVPGRFLEGGCANRQKQGKTSPKEAVWLNTGLHQLGSGPSEVICSHLHWIAAKKKMRLKKQ